MKINFENLSEQNFHLVIISPDNKKVNSNNHLDKNTEDILNSYLEKKARYFYLASQNSSKYRLYFVISTPLTTIPSNDGNII